MKAFTDISQSKKLAEILPPESADMWWNWFSDPFDEVNGGEYTTEPLLHKPVCYPEKVIPCWSLAALLEILPDEIIDTNGYNILLNIEKYDLKYRVSYFTDLNWADKISTDEKESFVDACVEMILKLKENDLI